MVKIVTADYYLDLQHPAINNITDDELFFFCSQKKNVNIERDETNQVLKQKLAYITPDFIIELMSPSDRLKALKTKMVKWIEKG
jgi:Uma2 family endonuclease